MRTAIMTRNDGVARDAGLEHLLHDHLGALPGLSGKAMFGGYAWLLDGHLLCG